MNASLSAAFAACTWPGTELATRALRFAEEREPDFIFRHGVRSYLFAKALADQRGLKPGTDYDDELVFLGCVLHDLGLAEEGNGDQRFEVDGADLAARFLRDHGVAEADIAVVWDIVALHTSDGIASRKGPDVALAQAGIAADVFGRDKEQLPAGFAERVHATFPRADLAHAMTDLIVEQALANPLKAGPLSFPGQLLRRHLPSGSLPDWYDIIGENGWGDRPATARTDVSAARTPQELAGLFTRYLAAGDLDALVSLYEPGAVFADEPEAQAVGTEAIKDRLRTYITRGAQVTFQPRNSHTAGDLAVLSSVATVTGLAPDGAPVTTTTTEVVRRQPDGRWLYAINAPFFAA
ncbi:nuclear transport factor 2 family protein [Streptomyces sp. TRM49041]|uniref:nuclear transport factor 2 family protein n=1 Tax=Streptomyces sp. TRM49041 TaxID=2603216 RepID=UPI0011EF5CFD|nr:nuclear transport factor 2 family protein [Streptomyces sp. TRM49041]